MLRAAIGWARGKLAFIVNGRAAPPQVPKAAAELVVQNAGADVARLAEALQNGELTLAQWESGMAQAVKRMHGAQSAIARGGWGQMDGAAWGKASKSAEFHLEYLRGFAERVQQGKYGPDAQSPAFNAHSQQYVSASRASYENTRLDVHKEAGLTEARRVLAAAHHCDECIAADADGWVSIDDVLPVGDQTCRSNCNCILLYR